MNEPEYVENYADQFSAVQMIFYIAKKSIFYQFYKQYVKNLIFYIFLYIKKKGPPHAYPQWRGLWYARGLGRA